MKKLIAYILPLILAISLSGCYTQFQTLNNDQYYSSGDDYGYAPSNDGSAYTDGYRTGWNDYSLYSFRDYNYSRYWANYYGGYYTPYWSPYYNPFIHYGYIGFGYNWDPYFAFNFGFYNYGYSPYGYGYYPYGNYGYGFYNGYYHHYYSYNYYEVPNSGSNIYRNDHPRSSGIQPVNRNTGSYGYSRPERGGTYAPRSSGSSGKTTQGTYNSQPRRQPRSTSGTSVRSTGSSRPERAPRSSGRSAPSNNSGSGNGGSRPDRGGQHQMLFNSQGAGVSTHSGTTQDNGSGYYRPQRNNRSEQQNITNNRSNFSFHSLIRPDRGGNQPANSANVTRTQETNNTNYNRPRYYQRTERFPSQYRNTYYYRPSHNNNRNLSNGYTRSSQSNNRSTYTVRRQSVEHFSTPRFDRAPRTDRSGNNSHSSSSSGNRPSRH